MRTPYLLLGLAAFALAGCAEKPSPPTVASSAKSLSDESVYCFVGMD